MNKLTAGIFAGILTIVTVNAANADIASKAYVDQEVKTNADAINLITTEKTGTIDTRIGTAVGNLKVAENADKTVANAIAFALADVTGGNGSISEQITEALGDIPKDSDVATELGKKQDKSTKAYSLGDADGGWTQMTDAEQAALKSGATTELIGKITTNETAISGINTKIGTVAEGKTVTGLIEEAKTAATDGVDTKLESYSTTEEMTAELAKKQNVLASTGENANVKVSTEEGKGTGNVVSAVTAADGVVTIERMQVIPEVKTTGEAGTYVLTAKVTAEGVTDYQWEEITRATSAPAE